VAAWLRDVFGGSRSIPESMVPVGVPQCLLAAGILQRSDDGLKRRGSVSGRVDLLLVDSAFPAAEEDSVFFGPDTYRFAASIR
ncbi:SAM-dependent methyltransferase, partial [Pseudomonas syringae pv. tagetis]